MDKETYAHWLDASWGDFRKQLLEAYPDVSRSKSNSVPRSPERISKMSNMSSQSDEETGCAAFQMAVQRSETDLTADLPMDMSTEQMPEERPDDRPQLVQIKTDDDGGDATSEGSRQTELAVEGQSCLRSGLEGLSYQEAHAIRNRLRLRLNAIHSNAMVSGKELHTAVASLGLTKHSVEEMNEFLNLLADFIGLKFVEEERQLEEDEEDDVTSSYTSIALLFSDHRGSKRASTKIRRPVWAWPTQKDVTEHSNALKEVKVTLRRSVTATTGMDTEIKCNHNMAPAQALMEVFLAKEGPTHKHIFGSKRMDQFRAMKEILLAGDTNRLVAELTFVRINDLASPPEAVHPLVYIEPLVALLIIGNGVMIGFQTEPAHQEWPGWIYFEMSFAFVLWIEIGFRMRLLRCFQYWCGPERYWNWFDILLAGTGFSDIVLQLASGQEAEIGGTGLLRFCRLIRLVRIVKVFRIKILKDLRLMIRGLIAGIKTLSLAFLLLFAVLYVIAGFATISFGTDEKTIAIGLASYFKNIPATMFTAFRCFNGECVTDSGQPIPSLLAEEFGLPFILSYVASYMLVTMGIFNVILAVYVDITMRAAKENDIQTAEAYARESIRIARTTRELLKRFVAAYHAFCDMEENGTPNHHGSLKKLPSAALLTEDLMTDVAISKELFLLVIQDKKIQRLMDELDLPPDRANLFEVIDADGSGTLQMAELLHGLLKIRGEVNKSDTVASYLATKACQSMVQELKEESLKTVLEMRAKLYQQMLTLEDKLDSMTAAAPQRGTGSPNGSRGPEGSKSPEGMESPDIVRDASCRSTPISFRRISKESGQTELLGSKSSASRSENRSALSTPSVVKESFHSHSKLPRALTDVQPSAQPALGDVDGEPSME